MSITFDEKRIDDIFVALQRVDAPGAAVGIAVEGQVVYCKAFGLASFELPIRLSPTVRMPLGSATKQFTCLAYLLLCERGMATVDDTIGQHLPQLHPQVHGVTLRQLMSHMSGLPDAYEEALLLSGGEQQVSAAQVLDLYRRPAPSCLPAGEAWNYNNGAYLILAAIIERISGQFLEELFKNWIFDPIGMKTTFLRRFDNCMHDNCASLHVAQADGSFTRGTRTIEGFGQGGIYSTVQDQLRWLDHMNAPWVGRRDSWEMMRTPAVLRDGQSTCYGLGLQVGQYLGKSILSHAGGVSGGNSVLLKTLDGRLDIVILSNRDDVSATHSGWEILDSCLPAKPVTENEAKTAPVIGVFASPANVRVIQLFARNELQLVSIDGDEFRDTARLGETIILSPGKPPACHSIRLNGDIGQPRSITLREPGYESEFFPVDPSPEEGTHRMEGEYWSESASATAQIRDEELRLECTGRFAPTRYWLEPIAKDIWRATSCGSLRLAVMVTFERKGDAFHLFTSRMRRMTFARRRA